MPLSGSRTFEHSGRTLVVGNLPVEFLEILEIVVFHEHLRGLAFYFSSASDRVAAVIFHVDMDAFFVSVEEIFDPLLKGKAVIVGGVRDERGVVAAASYAARKFGIHSAMPLRTAAKLAPPNAIFMEGHPERYREYSTRVYEVLKSFSPLVEMASVDEAYLDMGGTERLHGPPLKAADLLHDKMKVETQNHLVAAICAILLEQCPDLLVDLIADPPNGV